MDLPIIYVSKKCNPCRRLLALLQNKPELKGQYRLVCIDDSPYPSILKSVPAMILDNQVINSTELFQHINNYNNDSNNNSNNNQNTDKLNQQTQNLKKELSPKDNCNIDELSGLCLNDSCGLSFSSFDNNEYDNSSYSLLDEPDQPQNLNSIDNGSSNSKSSEMDKNYERLMKERGEINSNGRFA